MELECKTEKEEYLDCQQGEPPVRASQFVMSDRIPMALGQTASVSSQYKVEHDCVAAAKVYKSDTDWNPLARNNMCLPKGYPNATNHTCMYSGMECYTKMPSGFAVASQSCGSTREKETAVSQDDVQANVSQDDVQDMTIVCNVGSSPLESHNNLKKNGHQAEEMPFTCRICWYGFKDPRLLVNHFRLHKAGELFLCNICGETFAESLHCAAHMPTHRTKQENKHQPGNQPVNSTAHKATDKSCTLNVDKTGSVYKNSSRTADVHGDVTTAHTKYPDRDTMSPVVPTHDKGNVTCTADFTISVNAESDFSGPLCNTDLNVYSIAPFICSVCDIAYQDSISLLKHYPVHQLMHSSEKADVEPSPFKCPYCQSLFRVGQKVIDHIQTCSKVKSLPVSQEMNGTPVTSTITRKAPASSLVRASAVINWTFLCSQCDAVFKKHQNLLEHYKIHIGEQNIPEMTNEKGQLICPECYQVCRDRWFLTHHYHVHTGQRPFRCSACGDTFGRPDTFKEHFIRRHTAVQLPKKVNKSNSNALSDKNGTGSINRKQSKGIRTAANKSKDVSPKAGISDEQYEMVMNILKMPTDDCPYYFCSECDAPFTTSAGLIAHFQAAHDGTTYPELIDRFGWFVCTLCGFKHYDRSRLQSHFRTHLGERPFGCDICGHVFGRADSMKPHRQTCLYLMKCKAISAVINMFLEKGRKIKKPVPGLQGPEVLASGTDKSNEGPFGQLGYSKQGADDDEKQSKSIQQSSLALMQSTVALDEEEETDERVEVSDEQYRTIIGVLGGPSVDDEVAPHLSCSKCDAVFTEHSALMLHFEQMHTKEMCVITKHNNYFCTVCGAAASSKVMLWEHSCGHNGEKPYKCHLCGHLFAESDALSLHRKRCIFRRIHQGLSALMEHVAKEKPSSKNVPLLIRDIEEFQEMDFASEDDEGEETSEPGNTNVVVVVLASEDYKVMNLKQNEEPAVIDDAAMSSEGEVYHDKIEVCTVKEEKQQTEALLNTNLLNSGPDCTEMMKSVSSFAENSELLTDHLCMDETSLKCSEQTVEQCDNNEIGRKEFEDYGNFADHKVPILDELDQHKKLLAKCRTSSILPKVQYYCSGCNAEFECSVALLKHFNSHVQLLETPNICTGQSATVCNSCGADFLSSFGLECHMLAHVGGVPYQCSSCDKKFKEADAYELHTREHILRIRPEAEIQDVTELPTGICIKTDSSDRPYLCGEVSNKFEDMDVVSSSDKSAELPACPAGVFDGADESSELGIVGCNTDTMEASTAESVGTPVTLQLKSETPDCTNKESGILSSEVVEQFQGDIASPVKAQSGDENRNPESEGEAGEGSDQNIPPFKCSVCQAPFYSSEDYFAHYKDHPNQSFPSLVCPICHATFKQMSYYSTHFKSHKPNCFPCRINKCKEKFESKLALHEHQCRKHVIKKPPNHKCEKCGKTFILKRSYKKHQQRHLVSSYVCTVCEMDFITKKHLNKHDCLQKNTEQASYPTCGICGKTVVEDMSIHLLRHTKNFECPECHKVLSDFSSLRTHMKTHSSERPFVCKQCGATFKHRAVLQRHCISHMKEKPFKCDVCGKALSSKMSLKHHRFTHTGEQPYKPHICPECGKGYRRLVDLRAHGVSVHNNKKPYVCHECGATCVTASRLKEHSMTHSDHRPHVCKTCGKGFKTFQSLKRHEHSHSDTKRFQCNQCGKQFDDKRWYKVHLAKHTGDNKMVQKYHEKCTICGRVFTTKQNMETHMRVHTGAKPYVCDICGEAFRYRNTWRTHLKKKHCSPLKTKQNKLETEATDS